MKIKLENGKSITPKASSEIRCEIHNFVTTWGKLDPIQQLAFESGLDINGDVCILDSREAAQ
jgi:hypothetical protein